MATPIIIMSAVNASDDQEPQKSSAAVDTVSPRRSMPDIPPEGVHSDVGLTVASRLNSHGLSELDNQVEEATATTSTGDAEASDDMTNAPGSNPPSLEEDLSTQYVNDMSIQPVDNRLPITQSLGWTGCLIIIGGSFLIMIIMAFLIFLWAGKGHAGGQDATSFWRAIMLHDWATRAVTLSSVLLRTVVSAQAAVCTSLVAALLIERRRVRVSQIAQFSVTRSVNDGPRQLIQNVLSSRSVELIINLEMLLLIVLALGSLGVQFTSTILLPDLSNNTITQDPQLIQHNVALSPATQGDVSSYFATSWATLQGSNAIFGEVDLPSTAKPDEYGVSHSGPKQRAFLPFEREDRTRLLSYKGTAFTLNTEVVCLRPSVNARLQVVPWSLDVPYAFLSGEISYEQTFRAAHVDHSLSCYEGYGKPFCYPETFNCSIPSQHTQYDSEWATSMCLLEALGMDGEDDIDVWQTSSDLFGPTSMMFLVFASSGDVLYYDANSTQGHLGEPIPYGEWNSYELYPGAYLNVSLCFSLLNTTISEVEMASDLSTTEPEFIWSPNISTSNIAQLRDFWETNEVHKSTDERGILSISHIQHPISPSGFSPEVNASAAKDDISFSEWASWHGPSAAIWAWSSSNQSLSLCTACQIKGFSASKDGAALFMGIVNTSSRAAETIDSYIAKMVQNFYYIMLPLFDVPAEIEVVFSRNVSVPRHWSGLVAVLVMVFVNMLCVAMITALFVRNARYTRQGDFWHAASQLVSSERMKAILDSSTESKDKEVVNMLKENDFLVSIGRSADTGRVECLEAGDRLRKF